MQNESSWRDGKEYAQTDAVSASNFDNISIPRWDALHTDDLKGISGGVTWYAQVGYRKPAANSSGQLARNVAILRYLPIDCCHWESIDVMGYIHQAEQLATRRFGVFPADEKAERVFVNGKTQLSVYDAWRMRMTP